MRRNMATRRTATRNAQPQTDIVRLLMTASLCLIGMSLLPMIVLEMTEVNTEINTMVHFLSGSRKANHHLSKQPDVVPHAPRRDIPTKTTPDGRTIYDLQLSDLPLQEDARFRHAPIGRGVAGRPLSETPHVSTARRAHIACPDGTNIDSLIYWNVNATRLQSPFAVSSEKTKYITFSPDRGGWNNVRMSLEIIFVIAAATGRTLVLPPREPLYLMHHDKANKYRGFGDFFPLAENMVPVMSMLDYLNSPDSPPIPEHLDAERVQQAADHCDRRKKSKAACQHIFDYLQASGAYQQVSALHTCLVFDEKAYHTGQPPSDAHILEYVSDVCGENRNVVYFTEEMNQPDALYFDAGNKTFRLLTHFYGMIHFTDPVLDNYMKRFVRDNLHYHDSIYCAAGKIVKAVQTEAALLAAKYHTQVNATIAPDGSGGFSALHVRRGDLQYKKVKIPAQEWYDNTHEVWYPNELLYVATDERNKSFFADLQKHHELRYLDDYWDLAGLGDLDPNYMGMIDTIVASRGRAYAGTWFSTFSGYINRMRGYHGLSMLDSWYAFLPKKTAVHEWKTVNDFAYAFEWPDGWIGIDADKWPDRSVF